MLQVADVIAAMEAVAPPSLAEPWDNVGLMFGGRSWPVEHVLLALDPMPAVIAQGEGLRDVLVITHHPLFFEPIRALVDDDLAYAVVSELAQANMALYAAHTNLDKSPTCGTALALAEALGFPRPRPLAPWRPGEGKPALSGEGADFGFGCLVELPGETTRGELAALVARKLGARTTQLTGCDRTPARRVALVPGAGGDMLGLARAARADVMVTGELKHHQALEAEVLGPAVITAGHFETERPVLGLLRRALQERLPGLDIRIADESSPVWSVHTEDCGG
ncbi:Nif3-like dinuclear metal center hexameric protein [bacterium]|nr:Nif3-like dinuclear metal center hexameric protein [bacterium]